MRSNSEIVLGRLVDAAIPDRAKQAILDELEDSATPETTTGDASIYLTSIEVEGFRGVGPPTKLRLEPGDGLTVVAGPNGSGKSSIAEGLERILTGTTSRWTNAPSDGQSEWRNLHHSGSTRVTSTFRFADEKTDRAITVSWGPDDGLTGGTVRLSPESGRGAIAEDQLSALVDRFPTLLTSSGLDAVASGTPGELYSLYDHLVGLADLDEARQQIANQINENKRLEGEAKARRSDLTDVIRASELEQLGEIDALLSAKCTDDDLKASIAQLSSGDLLVDDQPVKMLSALGDLDLDEVERRVEVTKSAAAELQREETASAAEGKRLAEILEKALEFYDHTGEQQCPVCRSGHLDPTWREAASAELRNHKEVYTALDRSRDNERNARSSLAELLLPLAAVQPVELVPSSQSLVDLAAELKQQVDTGDSGIDYEHEFLRLAHVLQQTKTEAKKQADDIADQLRPVITAARAWDVAANGAAGARDLRLDLEKALNWLKGCINELRNERLASVSARSCQVWDKLRQTSSIQLGPLALTGSGKRRALELTCTTDGVDAPSRSVLSQGELNALAMSLFVPRATHESSPFRFLVLDDPIQALDPLKVQGFAETLRDLATDRQVVVFTHDNRLIDAIDRLAINARIMRIDAGPGSKPEIALVADPTTRAMNEAWHLAKDSRIPEDLRLRSVAAACSTAVEEAAALRFRCSSSASTVAEVDELLTKHRSFWGKVSLGLFLEYDSSARQRVERIHGNQEARLFAKLNAGGHHPPSGSTTAHDLVSDVTKLVLPLFATS